MTTPVLILTGECCRRWPILAAVRIGRCGLCGNRPRIISDLPPWELDD